MELPFVVGILADLSGNVDDPDRAPMRDRKYVEIDRDNFNDIMKSIGPKVQLNGGSKLVTFKEIDDFSPIRVLEQLEVNNSFKKRSQLSDAVAKLDGNVPLQQKLIEVLQDKDKLKALKDKLIEFKGAVAPPKIEGEGPKTEPAVTEEPKPSTENEGGKS
jgi:type VI secretion system protein ImpB